MAIVFDELLCPSARKKVHAFPGIMTSMLACSGHISVNSTSLTPASGDTLRQRGDIVFKPPVDSRGTL